MKNNFITQSLIGVVTLLFAITIFSACSAQQQPKVTSIEITSVALGDTVLSWSENIDYVLHDKNGNYWLASNGEGVYVKTKSALKRLTTKHGLCSDFVWSIKQDIHGKIWFTTRDVVCCYNGKTILNYSQQIANAPFAMPKPTNGGIFFNSENSMCYYDGTSFTNFNIHPISYTPPTNDLNRPYGVYSSLVDKNGNMWFGTQSEGVCYYNGQTFTFLKEKNLAGPAVRAMYQDTKGNLWFGNNGGGLYKYDGKTLRNITDEKGLGNPKFLKGEFNNKPGSLARVWAINEDQNGAIWIATIDAGIWKYDGATLTNYSTKDGLPANAVWGIYKNNQGQLLFGVNGTDIYTFNGKTFEQFGFE